MGERKTDSLDIKIQALQQSNKFVMICHTVEVSIIAVAYLMEYFKHARPLWYVILTIVLGFATPIGEIILYSIKKESKAIKHLAGIGFGAFYTFILLTTNNKLAFVYVIPMLIVILAYNDAGFVFRIALGCSVVNVVQVVVFLVNKTYTMAADSASIEIQVLVMILISIYLMFCSRTLQKIERAQLNIIANAGEESQNMLDKILTVSNEMSGNVEYVGTQMSTLKDAVAQTKEAMEEVNHGSTDTAEAVQRQLLMTENISEKVDGVSEGTQRIAESVAQANEALKIGSANIENLVNQMNESMKAGKEVSAELVKLNESMEQMKSVVDIINKISGKTGLLALNASIEAARAGEAGKGFAVVAIQISQMASDTKGATAQIQNMLMDFEETIKNVVTVAGGMVDLIDGQHEATNEAADSFHTIASSTSEVVANSATLKQYVEELADANKEIVDSISTISAISEEVAAHSNNTYTISEQNMALVADVYEHTERLKELAIQLAQ